jgi:hypothetical protein
MTRLTVSVKHGLFNSLEYEKRIFAAQKKMGQMQFKIRKYSGNLESPESDCHVVY